MSSCNVRIGLSISNFNSTTWTRTESVESEVLLGEVNLLLVRGLHFEARLSTTTTETTSFWASFEICSLAKKAKVVLRLRARRNEKRREEKIEETRRDETKRNETAFLQLSLTLILAVNSSPASTSSLERFKNTSSSSPSSRGLGSFSAFRLLLNNSTHYVVVVVVLGRTIVGASSL